MIPNWLVRSKKCSIIPEVTSFFDISFLKDKRAYNSNYYVVMRLFNGSARESRLKKPYYLPVQLVTGILLLENHNQHFN